MVKALLFLFVILIQTVALAQTVTDYDGNVYDVISINGVQWMKENLKVTHFNNGDPIPNVIDNTEWSDNTYTAALCYYNNDSASNAAKYGALYNGYTIADDRNVCPTNWHVATDADWNQMEYFIDNSVDTTLMNQFTGYNVGRLLKDSTFDYWYSSGVSFDYGIDSYGFRALPGGARNSFNGSFGDLTYSGDWWTGTAYDTSGAYIRWMSYDDSRIVRSLRHNKSGYSVRCVEDEGAGIEDNSGENNMFIYPNPATTVIYFSAYGGSNMNVEIYDLGGKLILSDQNTNQMDVSTLETGIYLVKLSIEHYQNVIRFVKQ